MLNPILSVVSKLRQDVAQKLTADTIRDACRQAGHRWRDRKLDPVATVWLFLLQILRGNTACQHVVHFADWSFSAVA